MIMDHLVNLLNYVPEQYKQGIKAFLAQVSPDMEERQYDIYGTRVFARVMSYETQARENCRIEAHDCYIDIQATIIGAEGIDVFDRKALQTAQEYERERDITFFHQKDQKPFAENRNIPGMFSMLFPYEAHRPQEKVDGYESYVKKFVIKMEAAS